MDIRITKPLVKKILEHATEYDWSIQGLGMLRLYLNDETRLHVWDSKYAVENVSMLHDHPWDFESFIVAGEILQYRYFDCGNNVLGKDFLFSVLQCGPGGCIKTNPKPIRLREGVRESYREGELYKQKFNEIHKSIPYDGTVSLVTRTFREDKDHARVFWEAGTEWVSAEPRPATKEEVKDITQRSLSLWF